MGSNYSSGKFAIASCDRCGFRFKLKQLKRLVIKTKNVNILVCPDCWEKDQPQLQLGMYTVVDPQALKDPRPESGVEESRDIQWGWNPVGFNNLLDLPIPDNLEVTGQLGAVIVHIGE
jgi:hypothetical protein